MAETVFRDRRLYTLPRDVYFCFEAVRGADKEGPYHTSTCLQLQACDTFTAILTIRQEQAREFDQARVGDESLTMWLNPTVSVLYAFSAALGGGVSIVALRLFI